MSKTTRRLAIGTVVAAAAGYVAGILTAPKSGKETRADIKNAAIKAKTDAEKKLKELHSELTELIDQAKAKGSRLGSKGKAEYDEIMDKATAAKQKARELLTALHDGDADDPDLKHALEEAKTAVKHLRAYLNKAADKK